MRKRKRGFFFPLVMVFLGIAVALAAVLNSLVVPTVLPPSPDPPCQSNHMFRHLQSPQQNQTTSSNIATTHTPMPLMQLADSARFVQCPDGMRLARDRPAASGTSNKTKIPRMVHQTAKSRCLSPRVFELTQQWYDLHSGWEYYFHDDEAMERLFVQEAAHFPLLLPVTRHCVRHGTLKADLWRYLVLWVYGGVYADLDTAPHAFDARDTISAHDEALFVVEQYHMLSQYWMAVAPRHPLMWYAVQQALVGLYDAPDTGAVPAAMVTGPHALHRAYTQFRFDAGHITDPAGVGYKPVRAGRFVGTGNRTVTVIGVGEDQNKYIHRDLLGMHHKHAAYKEMHMRHFQQDKKFPTGRSCVSAILEAASLTQLPNDQT